MKSDIFIDGLVFDLSQFGYTQRWFIRNLDKCMALDALDTIVDLRRNLIVETGKAGRVQTLLDDANAEIARLKDMLTAAEEQGVHHFNPAKEPGEKLLKLAGALDAAYVEVDQVKNQLVESQKEVHKVWHEKHGLLRLLDTVVDSLTDIARSIRAGLPK